MMAPSITAGLEVLFSGINPFFLLWAHRFFNITGSRFPERRHSCVGACYAPFPQDSWLRRRLKTQDYCRRRYLVN